ncbi:unnamed protein product [Phyllotreta striolata]|uniref:MD-2-related lipid-recognition domain-containing protein n=1 Tax=Phyllotreta striolata TaxID=444603 RepID=A0A9N9TT86_PHYSR|nr:unnamed protein product [Phyllotreta striolata]
MAHAVKYIVVLALLKAIDAHVHIDSIQLCEQKEYPIMWKVELQDSADDQIISLGAMDSKVNIDNDVLNRLLIYQKEGDKWNLFINKTDGTCKITEMFLGDFIKSLENAAGLKQTCPYPAGKYEIHNHPLDFSKFKYRDFPPGTLKIRSEFFPKSAEATELGCYEVEFTLSK